MSFPHMPQQGDQLSQAQIQKLNQLQQLQQMTFNSPQVQPRGLSMNAALLAQQQAQIPSHQLNHPQPQIPLHISAIKEVWADNLHHELQLIRQLITHFNYVSFSTEFPGILARPIGVFSSTNDYHYQTLRTNADLLNLVQFGISLSDANGKKPDNIYSTWMFNFKFDLASNMISEEAYESLVKTGIDFHKHAVVGIDQFEFAELLTSSGLVLLPDVHWSSFHAGYDFGFLVSLLTNNLMPPKEEEFLHKLSLFFPHLYDLKTLSKHLGNGENSMNQTLENLADELGIPRAANYVSAGGQALLTSFCFTELKGRIPDIEKYWGEIHGLKGDSQLNSMNDN